MTAKQAQKKRRKYLAAAERAARARDLAIKQLRAIPVRKDRMYNSAPKRNPARRKTARRKNAPKSQSKLLKNFTGVVRLNADKTVSIVGTGRKPNPSKKRRAKR